MNSNVVNKEVQPQFPFIDERDEKDTFLQVLRRTDMFSETLCLSEDRENAKVIRRWRDRLKDNQHLLDEPADRSLCKKLIRFFNFELRALAATRTHERFLSRNL